MKICLYNSKTRQKDDFEPINRNKVGMYVCGPTVYDRAHIGNARPVIVFDVLFRLLQHIYGKEYVTYVRNITDIDDKIIMRARETGRSIKSITKETISWYNEDMRSLGALPPSHQPRATKYVPEMIKMIEKLIDSGNAYSIKSGEVFFSVSSFPSYGQLANRSLTEMQPGARIEVDENKKNSLDFILWKSSDQMTLGWKSPWGKGRPGWHIECSAMSLELLGDTFDIHGGGIDLLFPHHENELAQSCCVNGLNTYANFWMHNGFLQVEGKKMSKSLGNFLTVKDLFDKEVPGEVIRMVLMSSHYRQPLDWSEALVYNTKETLLRWRNIIKGCSAGAVAKSVLAALCDDLNFPLAISELHKLAANGDIEAFLGSAQLLGLLQPDMGDWAQQVNVSPEASEKIERLIGARDQARKEKNFTRSDFLRKSLEQCGVMIMDTPSRTNWNCSSEFDLEKLKRIY